MVNKIAAIPRCSSDEVRESDLDGEISFDGLVRKRDELRAIDSGLYDKEMARLLAAWTGREPEEVRCALLWANEPLSERLRRPRKASKPPRKAPFGRYGRILVPTSA